MTTRSAFEQTIGRSSKERGTQKPRVVVVLSGLAVTAGLLAGCGDNAKADGQKTTALTSTEAAPGQAPSSTNTCESAGCFENQVNNEKKAKLEAEKYGLNVANMNELVSGTDEDLSLTRLEWARIVDKNTIKSDVYATPEEIYKKYTDIRNNWVNYPGSSTVEKLDNGVLSMRGGTSEQIAHDNVEKFGRVYPEALFGKNYSSNQCAIGTNTEGMVANFNEKMGEASAIFSEYFNDDGKQNFYYEISIKSINGVTRDSPEAITMAVTDHVETKLDTKPSYGYTPIRPIDWDTTVTFVDNGTQWIPTMCTSTLSTPSATNQ